MVLSREKYDTLLPMESSSAVSFVFGAAIPLARACRQACSYCGFRTTGEGIVPLIDLQLKIQEAAAATAVQILFLTGDTPQDDPTVQVGLHEAGFTSFRDYLQEAIATARDLRLFPVLAGGYLSRFDAEKLASTGAALQIDVVPAPLRGPGEAHASAPGRTPQAGRAAIESAHQARIPYHLRLLVGIGESDLDRETWIREMGTFCASDPYLQDVALVPFQPQPLTPFRKRPPIRFESLLQAVLTLREAFPVHYRSVPPHLCHRFPDLVEAGLNDLGAVPLLTGDPSVPNLPVPSLELLNRRLQNADIHLFERLPATTPAALRRTAIAPVLERQQTLMAARQGRSLRLVDNGRCFVCGPDNPAGLHVRFQQVDPATWATQWVPGTRHQGYAGIVHGGILSTLLDEAMAQCLWQAGHKVLTADMKVRFLHPVPVGLPLQVIGSQSGRRGHLHFTKARIVSHDGTNFAEAEGRFIDLDDTSSP